VKISLCFAMAGITMEMHSSFKRCSPLKQILPWELLHVSPKESKECWRSVNCSQATEWFFGCQKKSSKERCQNLPKYKDRIRGSRYESCKEKASVALALRHVLGTTAIVERGAADACQSRLAHRARQDCEKGAKSATHYFQNAL
jgi:hypothetical protein